LIGQRVIELKILNITEDNLKWKFRCNLLNSMGYSCPRETILF